MFGKSMIFYANQRVFDELDFENAMKEESKFFWVPVGPEMVEQNFFSVKESCVKSFDNLLKPFMVDET